MFGSRGGKSNVTNIDRNDTNIVANVHNTGNIRGSEFEISKITKASERDKLTRYLRLPCINTSTRIKYSTHVFTLGTTSTRAVLLMARITFLSLFVVNIIFKLCWFRLREEVRCYALIKLYIVSFDD